MADALRCDNGNHEPWLLRTVNQSRHVKEKVAACARELSMANRALKEKLTAHFSIDGVREAVICNEQMEIKVRQCVDDLQLVHAALAEELSERTASDQNLSENQTQAEQHRYLAFHDVLTGLANRALFNDRLEQALLQAQRHNRSFAVLFIDLDKFKLINDTYGHDFGDKVLKIVGERLQACVREEDTVGRVGGDEFTCLLREVNGDAAIANIAASMIEKISEACRLNGVQPAVQPSIGIAMFPRDGATSDALLKNSDAAMYKAKEDGTGYGFFSYLGTDPSHFGTGVNNTNGAPRQ